MQTLSNIICTLIAVWILLTGYNNPYKAIGQIIFIFIIVAGITLIWSVK